MGVHDEKSKGRGGERLGRTGGGRGAARQPGNCLPFLSKITRVSLPPPYSFSLTLSYPGKPYRLLLPSHPPHRQTHAHAHTHTNTYVLADSGKTKTAWVVRRRRS